MKFDVIVLAGSPNEGALKDCSSAQNEALIKIGDKYMVEYVVEALLSSHLINRIVVAGSGVEINDLFDAQVTTAEGGANAIETLQKGINVLRTAEPVLVVCSDIPLLTAAAIEDFIASCGRVEADLYYPIIRQQVVEMKFPKAKRTYVNLAEGVFTGGNIMMVRPEAVEKCAAWAENVVELRKHPVKLCQLLGLKMLLKFIMRKLSILEIEQKLKEILDITGVAVISEYAEIGVDVDKPVDLELVLANLDETA